jgi:hypothetical protein
LQLPIVSNPLWLARFETVQKKLIMGISISVDKIVGKRPLEDIRSALVRLDGDALGGGLDRVQV